MSTVSPASRRVTSTPHIRTGGTPNAATPRSVQLSIGAESRDRLDGIFGLVQADGNERYAEICGLRDHGRSLVQVVRAPTYEAGKLLHYRLKNDKFDFEKRACVAAENAPGFDDLSFAEQAESYRRAAEFGRALEKRLEEHVDRVLLRVARRRARKGIVDPTVEWFGFRSFGTSPTHREREQAGQVVETAHDALMEIAFDDASVVLGVEREVSLPRERSGPPPPDLEADASPTGARRTRRSGAESQVLRSVVLQLRDGGRVPAVSVIVDRRAVLAEVDVFAFAVDEQRRVGYRMPTGETTWRAYRRRDVLEIQGGRRGTVPTHNPSLTSWQTSRTQPRSTASCRSRTIDGSAVDLECSPRIGRRA